MATKVKALITTDHYKTVLTNSRRELIADEPIELGGTDLGFSPGELLCSALASCTSVTVRMYADRKGWALAGVLVDVEFERDNATNTTLFKRHITLMGNLEEAQKAQLLNIANKCPIHKILTNPITIASDLVKE